MKMNVFVSRKPVNEMTASVYTVAGMDHHSSTSERYTLMWRLCRAFSKTTAVPYMGAEKILALGRDEPEIHLGNLRATIEETTKIDMTNPAIKSAMEDILNQEINKKMRWKGYQKDYQNFLPKTPRTIELPDGEPIQLFEKGCKIQVEGLPSGHIMIWIDPKVGVKQTAHDYIKWKESRTSAQAVDSDLRGKKVILEPFGMSGTIDSLLWSETATTFTIDASPDMKSKIQKDQVTVQEYWKFQHHLTIGPDEGPLVSVMLKGRSTPVIYPPSKVYLSTKGKSLPNNVRRSFTMPPRERIARTEGLAELALGEGFEIGGYSIEFNLKMADESLLKEIGKLSSVGNVEKPSLLMGRGKRSQQPRDIQKYGPFSGPRIIPVYYIYPKGARLDINRFHSKMNGFSDELKIGQLVMIGQSPVAFSGKGPTRNDYWDTARLAGEEIQKYTSKPGNGQTATAKPVIISILPSRDSELYAGGKQGAHEGHHSIQNLVERSAWDISDGKRWIAYNTLVQVYLKSITQGEAPWILEHPAGGAKGTAYLGYDVSRRKDEETGARREAAATISMVDNLGRHLMNKIHTTQAGETLDQGTANRLVFEVSREAQKTFSKYGDDFERLVLFKDGIIRSNEAQNIQTGVEKAIEEMLPKETMPDKITIDLISVVKSGIERLYTSHGDNPEYGQFMIFSDNAAIVVTSGLSGNRGANVTVQTTRIDPKFRATESGAEPNMSIPSEQLVREFCDLCNLDWASLYMQPKYPIVLRLVQRLGEQYTLDIPDPDYLPL